MFFLKLINRSKIFFAILIFFSVLRNPLPAETVDMVVAKVNTEVITLSSVEQRFRAISATISASDNAGQLPQKNELMRKALDSIIEQKLKIREAQKTGFEVSDKSITKAFDEIKKNNNVTDEQFEVMLRKEGRSLESYKKNIRNQILASRITNLRMGKIPAVSKLQIKTYYMKHLKDYWETNKIRVRHILFILEEAAPKTESRFKKNKAREVLRQIRAGKDFAVLARKYSEDVSAHSGGEIGIMERGMMEREFEQAAFQLKAGETSGIVTTRYGLHIIKCDEVIPGFTKPLDQVKDEIKSFLRFQNEKQAHQKWVNDLKRNAFIEISLFEGDHGTSTGNVNLLEPQTASLTEDSFFGDDESKRIVKSKRPRKSTNSSSSQWRLREDESSRNYQTIMRKLKYYKKIRDSKKISESEYRKKKKELLRNF